ncbi:MAG TPA: capsule assembly Wzi family protein [Geobacteraceae bacterium]|nr:capsule assembly Wzi family protein [Geobacteraceae bacterium]
MKIAGIIPAAVIFLALTANHVFASFASNNIPLDSPIYGYLDKMAGFGLFASDFKGIRPITRSEAARLVKEAEATLSRGDVSPLATELTAETRNHLVRELFYIENPDQAATSSVNPLTEAKVRYAYLDGEPRNYARDVHDPGGEGVFGIGSGLRPTNPPGTIVRQQGTEGTPLLENNEGSRYSEGSSLDIRFSSEAHVGKSLSMLLEPQFITTNGMTSGRLNKGYAKLGSGGLELEIGRDANWLGFGQRGAITLSNNAKNFDLIKLSSPEPIDVGFLGKLKYSLIFSRFDSVMTANGTRQPYFYTIKASLKPVPEVEIGINIGRQQGGPGVNNSVSSFFKGLVGGTHEDNSNSLGGVELRWRIPSLRNSELYGEFSGEDAAKFWPIVESYLAGIFVPNLTADGRNDLRFEYFLGNRILYTHSQFTEGYIYKGMPIGHSQGGATQDFFLRYSHWFATRNNAGFDYMYTTRGNLGRLDGQSLERKNSVRLFWNLPLADKVDMKMLLGTERVVNYNLQQGNNRNNSLATVELAYRY